MGGLDQRCLKADDSSWAGWTSSLASLQPSIPKNTLLTINSDNSHLAPSRDSNLDSGDALASGTVVEIISQDPKVDSRSLYVSVHDGAASLLGKKGWIFDLDSLYFYPPPSATITYPGFDCNAMVPRSHLYDTGQYTEAFKEIEPLANNRCVEAEHLLGVMYGKGQGVQQDMVRAYALLLLAYGDGMGGTGGRSAAGVPVLGNDADELEIVQIGARLSAEQIAQANQFALNLAKQRGTLLYPKISETI